MDRNENPNPSALIPFCDLGGNISILGQNINELDIPVCSSFKEKFHDNQLCYEIDVNNFIQKENATSIKNLGLSFLVDTNNNIQIQNKPKKTNVFRSFSNIGKTKELFIILNNILHFLLFYIQQILPL